MNRLQSVRANRSPFSPATTQLSAHFRAGFEMEFKILSVADNELNYHICIPEKWRNNDDVPVVQQRTVGRAGFERG